MRAAVYYNNRDIRIEEMPVPRIGSGEILVKVLASGICGSDVMEWYRIKKAPLVLGHEIAGEIAEVGEDVTRYRPGQTVFVSHHVPCNSCHYCLNQHHTACETLHTTNFDPGGFAEYIRVPEINVRFGVFPLPPGFGTENGVFIEPLGCVVRAQRIVELRPGQSAAVLGSGISGLLHIAAARLLGAGPIIATDVSKFRMSAALRFGADHVLHADEDLPSAIRDLNGGRLADVVIVCTGALSAFEQALRCVDRGGTVLCFATTQPHELLSVPINEFWRNEIRLMPSYGNSPLDALVAIDLIRNGRLILKEMITHKLPLSETGRGFQLVASAENSIKVIIEPQR